ncbi:NapC/NirT family cytochrome c [Azospirillum sp. ST 5-10]|uniref:NapC/NirT family cytochrome c n=1 Tax=unclassified Azospirillum TaxID=2630922 RepID=UPI003F49F10B
MVLAWVRSRWRSTLALVGVAGVAVGVVGWGAFNTAMEATNSLDFCISCHEMRDTVYQEYQKSVHFQNASGVRAVCADCHVPRDWTHKLVRKVYATKELYHWLVGTIDTPEKFEAKRHELARHEWDRMRASDSRECRNCHSFAAMDFHKQSAKAASTMPDAMKAGKTCIDCHKGIAHKFPDIDAGHRRIFADLLAAAKTRTPAPGATAYALTGLDLLEAAGAAGAAGAPPQGEIAAATPVKVLAAEGGFLRVEITGWQRGGSGDTLYARLGRRIPRARLEAAAVARLEPLRTVADADTGRDWTEVRLVAWTRADGYAADRDALWDYAATIYDANCTLCHTPYAPDAYTADAWIGNLNAMKRLTRLDREETGLLQVWLQSNAKDTGAEAP